MKSTIIQGLLSVIAVMIFVIFVVNIFLLIGALGTPSISQKMEVENTSANSVEAENTSPNPIFDSISPNTIDRSVKVIYGPVSISFIVSNRWGFEEITFIDWGLDSVLDDVRIFHQNSSLSFSQEALEFGFNESIGLPFTSWALVNWETWENRYLEVRKEVAGGKLPLPTSNLLR